MNNIDGFKTRLDNFFKFKWSIGFSNFLFNDYQGKEEGLSIYLNKERITNEVNTLLELRAINSSNFIHKKTEVFNLFNKDFFEIYKFSHDNNFLYNFCSSEVYENHFDNCFTAFKSDQIDVNLIDFICAELTKLHNDFEEIKNEIFLDKSNLNFAAKSLKKKNDFLMQKAEFLGYKILKTIEESDEYKRILFNYYKIDEKTRDFEVILDLSNTTATEKIIYLEKLGVIDFLRKKPPFINSINSLATVFSSVTGEKSGTIQPMLNAMLGKDVESKNNPLHSEKTTYRVEQQLIKIGFKNK